MIPLLSFMAVITIVDLCDDWVTPYLDEIRRDRGLLASMAEALEVMSLRKPSVWLQGALTYYAGRGGSVDATTLTLGAFDGDYRIVSVGGTAAGDLGGERVYVISAIA